MVILFIYLLFLILDIDDPLPAATASNTGLSSEPSEDQISTLQDMGFSAAQAKKALRETVSNIIYMYIYYMSNGIIE